MLRMLLCCCYVIPLLLLILPCHVIAPGRRLIEENSSVGIYSAHRVRQVECNPATTGAKRFRHLLLWPDQLGRHGRTTPPPPRCSYGQISVGDTAV